MDLLNSTRHAYSVAKNWEDRVPILMEFYSAIDKSSIRTQSSPPCKDHVAARALFSEAVHAIELRDLDLAQKLLTKCVAKSPSDSQILSLAFLKRSFVLKAQGFNRESVVDLLRALDISDCPLDTLQEDTLVTLQELSPLLQQFNLEARVAFTDTSPGGLFERIKGLKTKLEAALPQIHNQKTWLYEELPSLGRFVNSEHPCISAAVQLQFGAELGWHLVAKQAIAPGEILLVEKPFACVLEPHKRWENCGHCLRRSVNLLPCPTCDRVLFCSDECRRDAAYHYNECEPLRRYLHSTSQVSLDDIHLIRIVATVGISKMHNLVQDKTLISKLRCSRSEQMNFLKCHFSEECALILSLESHLDDRVFDDVLIAAFYSLDVLHYFSMDDSDNLAMLALFLIEVLFCRECNAHKLVDITGTNSSPQIVSLGAAMFARSSLINHSCDPNMFRVNYSNTLVHRASRPIMKGEQLTISYGVQYDKTRRNERYLFLQKYFFTCKCAACADNWPLKHEFPSFPDCLPSDETLKNQIALILTSESENENLAGKLEITNSINELSKIINLLFPEHNSNQTFIECQTKLKHLYRLKSKVILCDTNFSK